ncbi:MAG: HEPN domain-containing protein [Chloroflexi bacterium]|nr:MAG: HEPN domain-containing protein [Chloroflexota bacterium]
MTSDLSLVIKKAKDNLEAAELLIGQGFVEIAASRAYYAMFYLAEA